MRVSLVPLVLLVLAAMTGCAAGPSLRSRMAAYIGSPTEKLVQSLGVPDKQITVDGTRYLAYSRQRIVVDTGPTLYQSAFFGGPFWAPDGLGFLAPTNVNVWRCEITFQIRNDKVTGFTLRGNDC